MKNIFRTLPHAPTIKDLSEWARDVTRSRLYDVSDYNEQTARNSSIFSSVPSSSSDLAGTEKAGDIAVDSSYLYIVVDNAGVLEWRRVAINSF